MQRRRKRCINLKVGKIDKPLIGKLESPDKRKEQRLYPEWWRGRPFEATATNISFMRRNRSVPIPALQINCFRDRWGRS